MRDAASQRQVDAADPTTSTWLSANAGSGKTRVLTDRVARLLLEGVSPQNILCLTYTKAAAAEMQNETPGGLKIQTIHSFCAGVLRRFPLEAEVSPQFREMEDRQAELLRAEVMDKIVQGPDAQVVTDVLTYFTGDDLAKFTAEIANKRGHFNVAPHQTAIHDVLDLPADAVREDALEMAFLGDEKAIVDDIVILIYFCIKAPAILSQSTSQHQTIPKRSRRWPRSPIPFMIGWIALPPPVPIYGRWMRWIGRWRFIGLVRFLSGSMKRRNSLWARWILMI